MSSARKNIVVAYGRERVIGHEGDLPWRGQLPADLKYFKELTRGHPVIMGRATYESIGRPLPERQNIVLSRQTEFELPDCETVQSLEEAYQVANDSDELFIIGGAKIYHLAMPSADRLFVTEIDANFEGDTFFPEFSPLEWREVSRQEQVADEVNHYNYTYIEYERIK